VTTYEPLSYLTVKDKVTDCAVDNCIALTFDDGPDPQTTVEILRILREKQVKATFFVVGNRVVQHPEILRQMHADGHEVGNHSWDHANMTRLNDAQIRDQVSQTQAAVRDAGLPTPEYFRPPYLARNERVQRAVNLPMILWNNDPEDWRKKRPEQLGDSVRDQAKSGGIVLLHDTKELTVRTLPAILDSLCKDYHCVTINQLLDMPLDVHHEFTSR
jgi:peptidoglycan/xylan/chitin deacetylase (PgdA/CDA1 family)